MHFFNASYHLTNRKFGFLCWIRTNVYILESEYFLLYSAFNFIINLNKPINFRLESNQLHMNYKFIALPNELLFSFLQKLALIYISIITRGGDAYSETIINLFIYGTNFILISKSLIAVMPL